MPLWCGKITGSSELPRRDSRFRQRQRIRTRGTRQRCWPPWNRHRGAYITVMLWRDNHTSELSGRPRHVLAGMAAILALLTPPQETGELVPSIPIAGLPPAHDCAAALPIFGHMGEDYTAPHGSMELSNDGGWCLLQFTQTFRQIYIVPSVSVVDPPAHGQVVAQRLSGRIALAYRPATGFTGADHFAVRTNGPMPHTIPVDVTVR